MASVKMYNCKYNEKHLRKITSALLNLKKIMLYINTLYTVQKLFISRGRTLFYIY